jgi:hypothetical protein
MGPFVLVGEESCERKKKKLARDGDGEKTVACRVDTRARGKVLTVVGDDTSGGEEEYLGFRVGVRREKLIGDEVLGFGCGACRCLSYGVEGGLGRQRTSGGGGSSRAGWEGRAVAPSATGGGG